MIKGRILTAESGDFRFNLVLGQEGIYCEIRAVGMNNVTSEFVEYDLDEIGKEFISTSCIHIYEMRYVILLFL